jgi:hypothetical protein
MCRSQPHAAEDLTCKTYHEVFHDPTFKSPHSLERTYPLIDGTFRGHRPSNQRNHQRHRQYRGKPRITVPREQSRALDGPADPPNRDCGYPSSVELADGKVVTLYYQVDDLKNAPESASARAILWSPPSK